MRLSILRSAAIAAIAVCASTTCFCRKSCFLSNARWNVEVWVQSRTTNYDMHGTNSYAVMHFVAQHYSTLLTFDWKNFPKLEGDLQKVGQCQMMGCLYF